MAAAGVDHAAVADVLILMNLITKILLTILVIVAQMMGVAFCRCCRTIVVGVVEMGSMLISTNLLLVVAVEYREFWALEVLTTTYWHHCLCFC